MKTIAAIVLLSCCALSQDKRAVSKAEVGCGPQDVKFEVKSDESQHPAPTPEDGKALIYFVADGHLTSIFGFDEKWVGPSTVERISSCQLSPVNTISARCCNPFFHREALEFRCIH
jgi:hypothetical protein